MAFNWNRGLPIAEEEANQLANKKLESQAQDSMLNSAFDFSQGKPVTAEDAFLKGHPVLKGISDIVGTTGLGRGIAQGIFLKFTPEGKELLRQVSEGKLKQKDVENVIGKTATTKEILGSAAQTATTIATAGLGAAKAPTAIGRIAETGVKLGGISAISGGARAFGEDKGLGEIGKEAAISGGIGASIGIAGQTVSELAKIITNSKVAESIYNKVLGVRPKIVEKGKSPAKFLIEEGIGGSKKGILNKSQTIANEAEDNIDKIIRNDPSRLETSNIKQQIHNRLMKLFGNSLTSQEVGSIVDDLPLNPIKTRDFVSPRQINALRRVIDNKFLGDAKWLNQNTSEKVLGLKAAANTLRELVKNTNEQLPSLFDRLQNSVIAIKSLNAELAKPHILTNLIELLLSSGVGLGTGGLTPEGVSKTLATFGGLKLALSAPVATAITRLLTGAGSAGKNAIVQQVSNALKIAVPPIAATISKPKEQ